MRAPPAPLLLRLRGSLTLHIGSRGAGRTRSTTASCLLSSRRSGARARAGCGRRTTCTRTRIRMLTRSIITPTIPPKPPHHALIIRRARTRICTHASRVIGERREVGRLAAAGPDRCRGAGVAAAGLGGAHEVAACLRAGGELAGAGREDLGEDRGGGEEEVGGA